MLQNQNIKRPAVISFVAHSGSGKTTLLEKLVPVLKERGYRTGVIKHDAHRFEIDHPGKDSYRLSAAGADTMLITSDEKLALVKKHIASPPVEELVKDYFSDMDLVLIEGFRMSCFPKIEIHRKASGNKMLSEDNCNWSAIVAIASDEAIESELPVLGLDDVTGIADFIERLI